MIKRIKRKYTVIVMSAVVTVLVLIITAINVANYSSINSLLYDKVTMLVSNEGLMPELPFGEKPEKEESKKPNKDEDKAPDESEDGDNADSDGKTDVGDDGNTGDGDNTADENTNPDDDNSGGDTEENPSKEPADDEGDGTEEGGQDSENKDNTDVDDEDDASSDNDKKDEEKEDNSYQYMSPETPYELRYFSVKLDTDGGVIAVDISKIAAVDITEAVEYAKKIHGGKQTDGFIDSYKYKSGKTKDGNLIYVFLDADRELKSLRSFIISSCIITAIGILAVFAIVVSLSGVALKPIIESYEKQKRFITDAGHEMKTPLTVISANAEIIELENGESQWIDGIKNQVSKLADLTEKLVILSKMEEGAQLEMNEFSLSDAFFDTCDQYKSIAMSKNIRFELQIAENVTLVGNENEIRRCICLLLDNAFRYVNSDGYVTVSVQNLLTGTEIKFKNSTDGVEKGSLDKWFDRFYRRDLSRNSATGGSGIGLSVVKAIVHAHGGNVHASSADGTEVEFTINI